MNKTVTFDPDEWQLVPRRATRGMVMDLQRRAADILQIKREDDGKGLHFNCDFGLVYRLMLAAAPVHDER
jgi:hypothetical protein